MRKIEQLMINAINNKTNWKLDNTEVVYLPAVDTTMHARIEHSKVYLHGNHIATINHDAPHKGLVTANPMTLSRWPSPTTKSRLRALGVNVYTRKGVTYLNDRAVN
jgi:hypothetical protein